jgi:transcriptional regulator with XRE-family HTH domain
MKPVTEVTIGERVARVRIARGISQEVLAGLVGRSASWMSKVERGVLPLDRRSVVLRVAQVLDVDAGALEGRDQTPTEPATQVGAVLVGELRQALMRWSTPMTALTAGPRVPGDGLATLRQRVDDANRLRQNARFGTLAASLPALLDDLREATLVAQSAADQNTAQTLATEAMHDARAMTKKLGHLDLAWMAAVLAGQAAARTDDPLLGATNAWNHVEVYKAANASGSARSLALAVIDDLTDGLGHATPGHLSLYGTMHLQAASIAAHWNNRADAATHLGEAADAARRLGCDANHYETMFGPTNVAIHRVAVAVEFSDATAGIDQARRINAAALGRERRARLAIDLARAFDQAGQHDRALGSVLVAEKLAPDYVRPHPLVHAIVAAHRRRPGRQVPELARRIGLP